MMLELILASALNISPIDIVIRDQVLGSMYFETSILTSALCLLILCNFDLSWGISFESWYFRDNEMVYRWGQSDKCSYLTISPLCLHFEFSDFRYCCKKHLLLVQKKNQWKCRQNEWNLILSMLVKAARFFDIRMSLPCLFLFLVF